MSDPISKTIASAVHMSHCYQGEYEDTCKYGDQDCPARAAEDIMTLRQWATLERLRLDEFMAWWENGAAGHNTDDIPVEAFPAAQPVEEWDEHYRSWGGGIMSDPSSKTTIQADMWSAIKDARDAAANRLRSAQIELDRLNDLLARMKAAGMNSHLPSVEDIRLAWTLALRQ